MALAKVFRIELNGTKEVEKNATAVKKIFQEMVDAIKKSKAEMAQAVKAGTDNATITALNTRISEMEKKLKELNGERKRAEGAARAQAAAEEKLERQMSRNARLASAAAGSYALLYEQYKKERDILKYNFALDKTSEAYLKQLKIVQDLKAQTDEFARDLTKDGTLVGEYTTGIIQAFQQMGIDDILRNQINNGKNQLDVLKNKTNELVIAYRKAKEEGVGDFNALERQIHDNVEETQRLTQSIRNAEAQLNGIGGVGTQITKSISDGFKSLRGQVASFALQYIGIQALISKTQEGFATAGTASDQTTDLELQLNNSAEAADKLNASLSKLDTRTTVIGLQEIADIALKAGVSGENIAEVTKAIDQVKVAFGKDFGSIESGTETFAKLIAIFFEDGEVTGERILKIGNGIRELANSSTASVPYLTDFAGRMAGVKQIANVSLPDILGLGAGFEQFKQSAETSSTALVKIIPKLAEDTEKYAQVAGMTKQAFADLLNNNPVEALITVSEALVKNGKGIEEVSEAFADSELGSGRITTILATLGGKADIFRESIKQAGGAMEQTGAITDAFNKKNTNLAATMDKASKRFTDAFASDNFQKILAATFTVLGYIINALPTLLVLLGLLATAWTAQNAALIGLRLQLLYYNLALGANYTAQAILRVAMLANTVVMFAYNNILKAVTATMRLFGVSATAASGPLGVILAAAALLGSVLLGLNKAMAGTVSSLDAQRRQSLALNEVNKAASAIYTQQIAAIESWMVVIKASTSSADTKMRAVAELTKINKAFGEAVKDNVIDLNKLDEAYKKVTTTIIAQATAQASADLTAKKGARLNAIKQLRQDIEVTLTRGSDFSAYTNELSGPYAEVLKELKSASSSRNLSLGAIGSDADKTIGVNKSNVNAVLAELRKKEDEATNVFLDYLEIKNKADRDLENLIRSQTMDNQGQEVNIAALKKQIEDLDNEINEFKGSEADLKKKVAERKKLQDELDRLLGNNKTGGAYRGARLTGEQKDAFKDIDAARDKMLAENEKAFLQGKQVETRYLGEILNINVDAINKKLALIKGKNAEERQTIAELNLQKIQLATDTNKKLFDIDNKALESRFALNAQAAQMQQAAVLESRSLSNLGRIRAQEQYLTEQLKAQAVFNQQQLDLERQYGITSIENEQKRKEAIAKIIEDLRVLRRGIGRAEIDDIRANTDRQITEYNTQYSRLRQAILSNNRITNRERRRQIAELDRAQQRTVLSAELDALNKEVARLQKLRLRDLASREEYQKAVEKQQKKAEELQNAENSKAELDTFGGGFSDLVDNVSNLLKLGDLSTKEIGKSGISIGRVISDSYEMAAQAMNSYFDQQRERINEEKDLRLEALDRERERVLARAESAAEEETIDRQYAAKRRQIEKEAGEQLKKSRRAEAKLALAAELANIAVAAAANPANAVSFGTAGIIQFAVLSGLALGRYAIRNSEINAQAFAKGGKVRPAGNGRVGGSPNIPEQANGDNVFATLRVGEAVLNEQQIRRLGGPAVLRSIGVPGFATGGVVSPQFGRQLNAPVFNQGYYSRGMNQDQDMNDLKGMVAEIAKAVYASDKKDVVLDPKRVTRAQDRNARDVSIATL